MSQCNSSRPSIYIYEVSIITHKTMVYIEPCHILHSLTLGYYSHCSGNETFNKPFITPIKTFYKRIKLFIFHGSRVQIILIWNGLTSLCHCLLPSKGGKRCGVSRSWGLSFKLWRMFEAGFTLHSALWRNERSPPPPPNTHTHDDY